MRWAGKVGLDLGFIAYKAEVAPTTVYSWVRRDTPLTPRVWRRLEQAELTPETYGSEKPQKVAQGR